MKKRTKAIMIFAIIVLIVLMLYFIVNKINSIDNSSSLNPSGNMDVFDIDDKNVKPKPDDNKSDNKDNNNTDKSDNNSNNGNSNSNNTSNNNSNSNSNKNNHNKDNSDNNNNNNSSNNNKTDLIVSDNYSMWNSGRVRIFSNPLYNFESKIAPGSSNSYKFAIKNSNDFDISIDFNLLEVNPLNINMKYNLKQEDSYIIGNTNVYKNASEVVVKNVKLKAKKTIIYTLNWKWIDSDNDTKIGQAENANYALTINIGANQC